jgi:hypothetical protein
MQGSTAGELEAASLNHGFRRNSPNRASTRITAMAVKIRERDGVDLWDPWVLRWDRWVLRWDLWVSRWDLWVSINKNQENFTRKRIKKLKLDGEARVRRGFQFWKWEAMVLWGIESDTSVLLKMFMYFYFYFLWIFF